MRNDDWDEIAEVARHQVAQMWEVSLHRPESSLRPEDPERVRR